MEQWVSIQCDKAAAIGAHCTPWYESSYDMCKSILQAANSLPMTLVSGCTQYTFVSGLRGEHRRIHCPVTNISGRCSSNVYAGKRLRTCMASKSFFDCIWICMCHRHSADIMSWIIFAHWSIDPVNSEGRTLSYNYAPWCILCLSHHFRPPCTAETGARLFRYRKYIWTLVTSAPQEIDCTQKVESVQPVCSMLREKPVIWIRVWSRKDCSHI